ncbi:MAG: hypothetical protein H0Z19_09250 [Archaeoglobus sp.]|uniref:hypothetical protein n=1 Tax=Archaeoglobus sp. TaxID=1872626 RepID=UPI001D3D385E|nr:hypothetical protein [Archaeoglobus sp.]MBO8180643.1 hypothetical protein [Archaeoglobus sp.]
MPQKEKKYIHVDAEVLEAFKNRVFAKYRTLHKYLGEELSRAMAEYLKDSRNAHTKFATHTFKTKQKASFALYVVV